MSDKKVQVEKAIKAALDEFRPNLQADGGDVEYCSFDDSGRVHLKLTGACGGCPMAQMTLKMGVEKFLKDRVPEVSEVVQDTGV